jgi:DNA mismatch endonuclease (patch repair protein)
MPKVIVPKAPTASSEHVKSSMKGNKGKNTKPELLLRSELHKAGLRFRIHYKLIGKPDIVFPYKGLAVFVDGCYWHGCPKCYREPKTNTEYWKNKIARNQQRAKTVRRQLNRNGWRVMRVWEHELKNNLDKIIKNILKRLSKNNNS